MSLNRVTGTTIDPDDQASVHWQHCDSAGLTFHERVFEDQWLDEQGYVLSSPSAGRGASLFLDIEKQKLVLRHYRRGGFVRNFSEKSYVWFGLNRTRAWQEFDVLCLLEAKGLPAPRPYACQVKRRGIIYSATLITHYLEGVTLAEKMCTEALSMNQWQAVGHCISQFHQAGVNHADLNAHNILFDDNNHVSLIDFDRAKIVKAAAGTRIESNLVRLQRSLRKIDSSGPAHFEQSCWDAFLVGYENGFA